MQDLDRSSEPPLAAGKRSAIADPARAIRSATWWPKVVALGVGTLVSLLLAEIVVLLVAGEQPKFPRHVVRAPWGLRYNDPGSSYRNQSADMTAHPLVVAAR